MIRQLFSIIWKRRKGNFLLIFQLFVSFLALSLFTALNVEKFSSYFRPYIYDYKNIWAVSINMDDVPKDQRADYIRMVKLKLQGIPGTEAVANGSLIPFWSWGDEGHVKVGDNKARVRDFIVDENYQKALKLTLINGRWFNKNDNNSAVVPVVVSRDFSEEYFKNMNALGRAFTYNEKTVRIIGVSETYLDNHSSYDVGAKGTLFTPLLADTVLGNFVLRSNQVDNYLAMEEQVRKVLMSAKDDRFVIRTNSPLTMLKKQSTKTDLTQLTVALLIFFFLVFNIFLGISGVFSYNISKRKPEIGLRVATGAGASDILKQFLGETIVMASFAVIPGAVIAFQFFASGFFGRLSMAEGLLGIAAAASFIYLLMIACSFYPALRASKIQPSEALHEE